MKKTKYRPSVLGIFSLGLAIYALINGDWNDWGGVAKIALLFWAGIGIFIDYILGRIIKDTVMRHLIGLGIAVGSFVLFN